ncbi:MAG: TRAM domain-containing protein, partial [Dokdonella sp.]
YSARPGTPAANLPDETPLDVKKQRLARLQDAINANANAIAESMLGSVQSILVEGPSTRDANELSGRTENMRKLNFAGPARLIGQFVDVRVTEVMTNSLRGRIVTDETVAA